MASTGLNFANLTPDNGAVKDLRKLIFRAVLGAEQVGRICNVLPKQRHGEKAGYVGEFGLIGRASSKCNPEFESNLLTTEEDTWDIKEWEVAEKICYADLEGTVAQTAMKTGTDIADLTGTDYIDYILMPRLELAVRKMILRFAWFGDKEAKNVAEGGVLKAGVSASRFNVTDGFWKRIFALVAKDASRHTAIAANAETTWAKQKAAFRAAGVATGIMDDLISDASLVLREQPNGVIYITQAFKDALDRDIKANNKGSEMQWTALFDGVMSSKYNGIEVVVVPFFDEIIQNYEATANAGQYNKPFRAIYTIKDNLLVGTESESEISSIEIWFNRDEQVNKIHAKDKLGTLIAQGDLVQVAY